MRSLRCVVPLSLLLVAALGAAQNEHLTDAQQDGFLGPVKMVSTKVTYSGVQWQQPGGPTLVTPIWCRDCAYDPDGTRTMSGQMVDGKFMGEAVLLERDGNGKVTGQRYVSSTTGQMYRETKLGPHGRTEETDYDAGKVRWRQLFSYDQYGHMTDWVTLDNAGNLESHTGTFAAKDGTVTERSVWGKDGALQWRDIYDPETDREHFTTFDESGGVKLEFKTDRGQPVSFWEASDAGPQFGDNFSYNKEDGNIDNFSCHIDGRCDRYSVHYEYLDPAKKRNPTLAEWRDAQGNVMFGAYFEYEFDTNQNWTHRKVWVKYGQVDRTLYEDDARKIEYWQNESAGAKL